MILIFCLDIESLLRSWPDGDYSLPMSKYGCNDFDTNSWKYGYLNISFEQKVELNELNIGAVGWNSSLFILGPFGSYSYQMNFCTKVSGMTTSDKIKKTWPQGRYSIFGSWKGCPSGKLFCCKDKCT